MEPLEPQDLITPKEAAFQLSVSVDSVYSWVHSHMLEAYQPGGHRCAILIPRLSVARLQTRPVLIKVRPGKSLDSPRLLSETQDGR